MRRSGKHRIKEERPETSASISNVQDRDLTYFIHDRVELMHQVFSVLKPKEIKAMVPHCVQHISLNDLQELCTEEVRLCLTVKSVTESNASQIIETNCLIIVTV